MCKDTPPHEKSETFPKRDAQLFNGLARNKRKSGGPTTFRRQAVFFWTPLHVQRGFGARINSWHLFIAIFIEKFYMMVDAKIFSSSVATKY